MKTIGNCRYSAFQAIDRMYAAMRSLNDVDPGYGTTGPMAEYRILAVQDRGDATRPATPFHHLSAAFDSAVTILAGIDGFRGDDIDRLVARTGDVMHDMYGDAGSIAADAYAHVVGEIIFDAWEEAEYVDAD